MRKMYRIALGCVYLFAFVSFFPGAQEKTDFNRYYEFPFSMGFSYQGITPFAEYGSYFNVYELAGTFHRPLQGDPRMQMLFQLGMGQYDARDYLGDGDRWDHLQLFGGPGIAYVNRFSRDFEVGLDLVLGGGYSFFPELEPGYTVGLPSVYAELGGRLALDPSYDLSIEIHPKLKYSKSLPPSGVEIKDFDGPTLGLGLTIHYRFGEDPDSAAALIRSIKLSEGKIDSVFAAMQSYYVKHPVGKAVIRNIEKNNIENLELAFFQPGLMDAPTPCGSIEALEPGEEKEVPVFAFFNEKVFETEGVVPYTGELIVQYDYRNRPAEQRFSVSYDLHDKTALTWDDDRKVAAFITPADGALRNYTSFIRQSVKDEVIPTFNKPLQEAIQIYNALTELGCLYQSDPSSPFTAAHGDAQIVDSVNLPRDTLKRITGDCDDLTVLYCSLLETLGIESAFITVPGHIYAAFNTKVSSADYRNLHPDRDMTINLDGELWIPVEITMVGTDNFPGAWRQGVTQWHALDDRSEARGFYRTAEAQELFRPVGLRESDLGLQYGNRGNIAAAFQEDLHQVQANILQPYEDLVKKRGKKEDYNRLGIRYSLFHQYDEARRAFERALSMDSTYLSARINQGNLEFIDGDSERAVRAYRAALEVLERQGRGESDLAGKIMLNLAASQHKSEEFNEAQASFARAKELVPEDSSRLSHLFSSDAGMGRASEAVSFTSPFFIEEADDAE